MLDLNLTGRIAIVTGGSGGIGSAIALALAAQGAAVAVHYRGQADSAQVVADSILDNSGRAIAIQADLSQANAPDELVRQVIDQLGQPDILINNAGEFTDSSVADMTDDIWSQTIALNLTAAFACSRACLPMMKSRGWGRIISLTSQAAFVGSTNHAHYAAAKAGLAGFSYSLAKEVGAEGITVNLVAPGRIVTDMLADHIPTREAEWIRQTPMRRLGQPEEVAGAVVFLASNAASYITGATLHVNGGVVMS
ncbi:MAG: 3-oxoacyl-ACP reductase FabG [Anaerolineae bacterium]|nr:3-oxoacyl-ACP reductase FabG [Anaerolineae bacterium]